MAANTDRIEIKIEDLQTAKEIVEKIAGTKPLTSLSFTLNGDGLSSLKETLRLIDWGIGNNKPKLKEAALDVLSPLIDVDQGVPINVNLTEYEIKAMEEVLALLERSISKNKEGVVIR
ncbi:MAG: hypothetical protein PVF83_19600 [Anaerolineales bacterium]|jgi:hypothetical protein